LATSSFVPTPSALATRIASRQPTLDGSKRPPKRPTSPTTPGVNVPRIASVARSTASYLLAMSTPASR
jgi:hypothetical protein